MTKRTLVIIIAIVVAIAVGVALFLFISSFDNQEGIWVTGLEKSTDHFYYKISNKQIEKLGYSSEFSIKIGKDEFFTGLKEKFDVFDEEDDALRLIYNNEVYTVKVVDEHDNRYILYSNYFVYATDDGDVYYMPFPTNKMANEEVAVPRIEKDNFKLSDYDAEYLDKFYSVYKDVKVNENTYTYKDIILSISEKGDVKIKTK